jgi:hypothetical protein
VTSARQRDANRRNARASTGPRTSAGKARAAQNARRHGLSLPARYDPSRSDEIEALARAIAAGDADAERLELARRIAEAHIDIVRARSARWQLFPASPAALLERDAIARLAATDRYERRAWSRCKRAIQALDDARSVEPSGEAAWPFAERSQLRQAEQSASAPAPQAAGSSKPDPGAGSEAPSADMAEEANVNWPNEAKPKPSRRPSARDFGRTKPMGAVTMASSDTADLSILRLRPCYRRRNGSRPVGEEQQRHHPQAVRRVGPLAFEPQAIAGAGYGEEQLSHLQRPISNSSQPPGVVCMNVRLASVHARNRV